MQQLKYKRKQKLKKRKILTHTLAVDTRNAVCMRTRLQNIRVYEVKQSLATMHIKCDEGFILSQNRVFLHSPLDRKQCGTGLGEWVVFKSDHVLQIGLTYHMKPYWGIEQWK